MPITSSQTKEAGNLTNEDYAVKQVVRGISKMGGTDATNNVFNVALIDDYLTEYLQRGFKLVGHSFLGETPEAFLVLYVLAKQ